MIKLISILKKPLAIIPILIVLVAAVAGGAILLKPKIKIADELIGKGEIVTEGRKVLVNFETFLFERGKPQNRGAKVDSTYDRHSAMPVGIGEHQVITGLEQGLVGMQLGGRRAIEVPAALAYGKQGFGLIPPGAKLLYVVELIYIQPK